MTAFQDIHRAETIGYVLSLVRDLHRDAAARVAIYSSQPYAVALEAIARDRAFRLEQLVHAIEAGLYDQLDADLPTEAFVDVADAERYAQRDEYVNGPVAESEAVAYVEAARDVDPDGSRGPAVAEHFDAAEAADVRQIEHDMAVEAGMECVPETCAYCGGA